MLKLYLLNIWQEVFQLLRDFIFFLGEGLNWLWAILIAIGIFLLKLWTNSSIQHPCPDTHLAYTENDNKPKLEDTKVGQVISVVLIIGLLILICIIPFETC